MPEAIDLRESRMTVLAQANEILETAATDNNRTLSTEEETRWDTLHAEADTLWAQMERKSKQAEAEARHIDEQRPGIDIGNLRDDGEAEPGSAAAEFARQKPLRDWLSTGMNQRGMPSPQFNLYAPMRNAEEARSTVSDRANVEIEERVLTVGSNAAGGHTVGESFVEALEVALKRFNAVKQANPMVLFTGRGETMHFATSDDTTNEGELVAESAAVSEQDITFGDLEINAYKYSSKSLKISLELLQDSFIDIESFIADALGERIGRITGRHDTVGDGASKPNGVVSAATAPTALRLVAGSASIGYDNMIDLESHLEAAYLPGALMMMNRKVLAGLKKMKDTDGRPLWMPNLIQGEPATFNGYPYVINDFMEDQANGKRFLLFGQFAKYIIREVMAIELFRLGEKYIENGQIGFLAFARHDADLLDAGTHPIVAMSQAS